MQIIRSDGILKEYQQQIRNLLILCDNEFVPPLSSRISSTQQQLKNAMPQNHFVDNYFACLCDQMNCILVEDNKVIGFVSYIENTVTELEVYISTIIVNPDYRRKRYAQELYRHILTCYPDTKIRVRTWSTNVGHINLLNHLGFTEYRRIKDDRGEGIDTIYFEINANKKE